MPPTMKGIPAKRRSRKRKRRQVSSSSSSSSSEEETSRTASPLLEKPAALEKSPAQEEASSSSDSSSSSESSTEGKSSSEYSNDVQMKPVEKEQTHKEPSRSPSPVDRTLPMSLPLNPSTDEEKARDAQLRERFRKYWMRTMAEGFGDELQQLQKEPNMTKPRLAMLIDALAMGTELYLPTADTRGSSSGTDDVNILLGD